MPQASWPLCWRRERPSQISGAASTAGSWRRRPRIPHTGRDDSHAGGSTGRRTHWFRLSAQESGHGGDAGGGRARDGHIFEQPSAPTKFAFCLRAVRPPASARLAHFFARAGDVGDAVSRGRCCGTPGTRSARAGCPPSASMPVCCRFCSWGAHHWKAKNILAALCRTRRASITQDSARAARHAAVGQSRRRTRAELS